MIRWVFAYLMFFYAHESKAFFQIQFAGLSESQSKVLEEKLNKILPAQMQNSVNRKINVIFGDLGNPQWTPQCPTTVHAASQLKTPFLKKHPYEIIVHNSLRAALLQDERTSVQFSCGHHNGHRMALAAIVHQIGHIYDNHGKRTTDEDQIITRCEMNKLSDPSSKDSELCQRADELQKTISTKKSYKMMSGFFANTNTNKNKLLERLPDPIELSSAAEHFAVNLEYYLLDPEYTCRRPSLSDYFSKQFNQKMNADLCKKNYLFFLNSADINKNMNIIDLINFKRIYQIHYLLADEGKSVSGRWGHSMIRLVVCAPYRNEVGPECMKDVAYHLVVSYRANVADLVIDYGKGLLGGDPSKMFIYSLPEIISEYTLGELRNLVSTPLVLTEEQKNLFLNRVLEQYWEYAGNYYFVSNNCATETFDLIRSVLNNDQLNADFIYTPIGLFDFLKRTGVIDTEKIQDQNNARKNKYIFLSESTHYDQSVSFLQKYQFPFKDWRVYVQRTTAESRLKTYFDLKEKNKNLTVDDRITLSTNFSMLEQYAYEVLKKKVLKMTMSTLVKLKNNEILLAQQDAEAIKKYKDILLSFAVQSPQTKIKSGAYGIPLVDDLLDEKTQEILKNPLLEDQDFQNRVLDREFIDAINEQKYIGSMIEFYHQEASSAVFSR